MRISQAGLIGAALCCLPVAGYAQSSIAVPPPPPIVAAPATQASPPSPATPAPPGLVQTPVPPADNVPANGGPASSASGASAGSTPPAASMTPPAMPNTWVPGKTAVIGVLDKVDGGIANLQVPVGGNVSSGDMQISVLACVNRPADEIPDAAIFISIQTTDNPSGPPLFRGWMVRSVPSAPVVGDASESLRVVGCT